MEVGQGKDQGPELGLLCTALQDVVIKLSVRPLEVGLPEYHTLCTISKIPAGMSCF